MRVWIPFPFSQRTLQFRWHGNRPQANEKALPVAIGNDAAEHAAIYFHLAEDKLEHVGKGAITDTKIIDGKGMELSKLTGEG